MHMSGVRCRTVERDKRRNAPNRRKRGKEEGVLPPTVRGRPGHGHVEPTARLPRHLPGDSVLDDAMFRLVDADAAANVNWTACLRLASAAVPRVRRSHLRERAVSTVAFARAQPQDGVPTTTTRVRSLGTPIVHAGVLRCVTVTVAVTTTGRRF